MDLNIIGAAFVVVVVGGMGSIPGAYVAALLIAELKAVCIWLGLVEVFGVPVSFSKLTLVVEFVVMAVVLVVRPSGLLGRPQSVSRPVGAPEAPLRPPQRAAQWALAGGAVLLLLVPALQAQFPYAMVLGIDLLVAVLFAASLHFIMGPAGLHSFGHAAYFGLGAYGAALLVSRLQVPMPLALLGGVQTLLGPVVGAVTFTWLHDTVARNTDYWRALLGAIILGLVLLFPMGIAGFVKQWVPVRWGGGRAL